MVTLQTVVLGVRSSTLKRANEKNCISQVETKLLYLRDEFGDMMYWLTNSGQFNILHLDDGSSLLVMGEDLTNLPSNIPTDSWTTYTGQLSHLLTYGGSLTGSQCKTKRWRSCEDYSSWNNTQQCEGTSYVPRTSGRYILEEAAHVIYVQSKARDTFNNSPLVFVIMLEQTLKTDWAVHYVLVEREFLQENMLTKIKILMLLHTHSVFNSFQYC